MATLLPRLPGPAAGILLEQYLLDGFATWPGFDARNLPSACRFASTGGSRVAPKDLEVLRDRIVTIARSNGFGTSDTRQTAKFDAEMAASLADEALFAGGEALRDDVWTFVATAIAPDIAHWRFPDRSRRKPLEHYLGGVRNTFQRLWIRGRALDRGADRCDRWQLLEELTEDALVQITERPGLRANPWLARAIAEAWVRASGHHGRGAMEPLMRRAIKRMTALNEIRSVADLPSVDLVHVLNTVFDMPHEDQPEARLRTDFPRPRRMFTRALPGVREVLKKDGFDDVPEAEFAAFDIDAQRRAVWCVLSGEGAVPREGQDTVAMVARRLRDQGLATFERLNAKGALSQAIVAVLASESPRWERQSGSGLEWPKGGRIKRVRAYRPVTDMQESDWCDCAVRAFEGLAPPDDNVWIERLVWSSFNNAKRFYGIRTAAGTPCQNLTQKIRDRIQAAIDRGVEEGYLGKFDVDDGTAYLTLECGYSTP